MKVKASWELYLQLSLSNLLSIFNLFKSLQPLIKYLVNFHFILKLSSKVSLIQKKIFRGVQNKSLVNFQFIQKSTTLYKILSQFSLYFEVIIKSIIDSEENFQGSSKQSVHPS